MMQALNNAALVVTVFTGFLLILLAVGQLMARPLNAYRFIGAVMFFWIGLFLFSLGLGRELITEYAPQLYGIHVPLYFLIGPILQSYIRGILTGPGPTHEEQAGLILRFPGLRHLLPFIIVCTLFLPSFLMPDQAKKIVLQRVGSNAALIIYGHVLVLTALVGLISAAYAFVKIIWKLRIVELLRSGKDRPVLWHVRVVLIWITATIPAAILIQIMDDIVLKRIAVSTVALAILWLYLLDHRYPGFFQIVDYEIRTRRSADRYGKSKIKNLDQNEIIERMERSLRTERLYADEDLTLDKLAATVQIQPAQLSELLNNVMGVDFRSYVNDFRISAAKQMLIQELDRSVLSIGFAVGFNSKSAFNRNFKNIAGQTPAAYRAARAQPGQEAC